MEAENLISQFFIKDGEGIQGGFVRKSILLSLIEDLKFCLIYPRKYLDAGLDKDQIIELEKNAPSFTTCGLFSMGVDVLTRVLNKKIPGMGELGDLYKKTLKEFYKFGDPEIEALWRLRNSIIHQYKLPDKCWAGFNGRTVISRLHPTDEDSWRFCLRPMLQATQEAKQRVFDKIMTEKHEDKMATALYLIDYGFYITQAPLFAKSPLVL